MSDRYLWIGGLVNPASIEEYKHRGHHFMSSYFSQLNIINGIENSSGVVFDTINSVRLNPFPRYKMLRIRRENWSRNSSSYNVSVSYLNIKYLSVFFRTRKLIKEIKKWCKKHKNDNVYVFCFGMTSPFMKASIAVSKLIKTSTLVLINPDLPQYMEKSPSRFKKFLKKIDYKWIKKSVGLFDKQILYSKHMADFLNIPKDKWISMEGLIDPSDLILKEKEEHKNTVIMYCGVVGKMYGVDKLVKAFEFLNNEFELWIFGVGDYANELVDVSKKDPRIAYFGYCGDRATIVQREKNSDILISLINPEDEVSKYCFPSKIFEYMLSGNIVISSKIKGIPDEYFDYIFPLETTNPQDIANVINELSLLPKQKKELIGKKEILFILEKKNNLIQGKRIFNFVKNGVQE